MSQDTEQPKAASVSELKAACPGATSDFLIAQVEKGATVTEAMRAHAVDQQERLSAAEKKAADAQAKADAEAKAKGYLHAKGMTMRWASGAEKSSRKTIKIAVDGTNRQVTFVRPDDAPNAYVDAAHALQKKRDATQ